MQEDSAVYNIHYSPQLYGPYLSRFLKIPFQQVPWETIIRAGPKTQFSQNWVKVLHFMDCFIKHWWSSGRIVPCHGTDPGSIPGQCKLYYMVLFCFVFISGAQDSKYYDDRICSKP
ncbi:hypothetical protein CY35_17G061700 [Sphagnum magellanicum]|nr:hypothetical protein CY35_17G061700 [Sphagnum magellanicum]